MIARTCPATTTLAGVWRAALIALALVLAGCASRPINEPITRVDRAAGYRPPLMIQARKNNDPQTLFILSLSGGGTRAAALSYGVLEELRRTEIVIDGQRRRLIDEVDIITGVSGGSFTALAYALYGDRLFSEYEERFLKRNVQGELVSRALNPLNWWKFIGGSAGRSDFAADYYDEILFEGATFGDLLEKSGPVAIATATDLSTGARLAFYQSNFDLLCTDLDKVRLSRAAATSSAVPVVLSPVTFNNYGGTCGFEFPDFFKDAIKRERRNLSENHALQRYREMESLQNSKDRPFIHLVDGGVSDNTGAHAVFEALEQIGANPGFREDIRFGAIRRVVLMIVNARSVPNTDWDRFESPPGTLVQILQASGVPIDHYSYETVETIKARVQYAKLRRELLVAQARLAGATEAEAEASLPNLRLNVIELELDAIRDPQERSKLMNLPTSFALPPEDVDRLRGAAVLLLRQSADYDDLLRDLGGAPAQ